MASKGPGNEQANTTINKRIPVNKTQRYETSSLLFMLNISAEDISRNLEQVTTCRKLAKPW